MIKTSLINKNTANNLVSEHGTPLFVYSKSKLIESAHQMININAPFGLTVRYAMKANPNIDVLKVFLDEGISIDASSGFEADAAIVAGYKPGSILLTSQQIPDNLSYLIEQGVQYNATSLHQLERYGEMFPGCEVSVRINPGVGSGHSFKTNVGGISSSFGIWHEYIPQVHKLTQKYNLNVVRIHTHIGSGADPKIWQDVIDLSLGITNEFQNAKIINLGGGFKIARVPGEKASDMNLIGKALSKALTEFANNSGRNLHLELEPGTFLVANAGVLLAQVEDIVDTGPNGYNFIKLNTGMNDILRPGLYGAQHPIEVLTGSKEYKDYVVVGHNCESGDLLTTAPGNPETLLPRRLPVPQIKDIVVIGGVGAYCASMATHGYNSYPNAKELMV